MADIFSILSPILWDFPLPGKLGSVLPFGSPLHPQSPALCQHIMGVQRRSRTEC